MAIKLLVLGDSKEKYFKDSEAEYLKRLRKYIKLNYVTLAASRKLTKKNEVLQFEEEVLLKQIAKDDFLILLDENGEEFTSRKFADNLNKWMYSSGNVVFAIGGAFGFSNAVKQRANKQVSLSKLTFPHHLVRTLFLEQLYRAFTILNGEKYHND